MATCMTISTAFIHFLSLFTQLLCTVGTRIDSCAVGTRIDSAPEVSSAAA